jgi:hypothetical protein
VSGGGLVDVEDAAIDSVLQHSSSIGKALCIFGGTRALSLSPAAYLALPLLVARFCRAERQ